MGRYVLIRFDENRRVLEVRTDKNQDSLITSAKIIVANFPNEDAKVYDTKDKRQQLRWEQ